MRAGHVHRMGKQALHCRTRKGRAGFVELLRMAGKRGARALVVHHRAVHAQVFAPQFGHGLGVGFRGEYVALVHAEVKCPRRQRAALFRRRRQIHKQLQLQARPGFGKTEGLGTALVVHHPHIGAVRFPEIDAVDGAIQRAAPVRAHAQGSVAVVRAEAHFQPHRAKATVGKLLRQQARRRLCHAPQPPFLGKAEGALAQRPVAQGNQQRVGYAFHARLGALGVGRSAVHHLGKEAADGGVEKHALVARGERVGLDNLRLEAVAHKVGKRAGGERFQPGNAGRAQAAVERLRGFRAQPLRRGAHIQSVPQGGKPRPHIFLPRQGKQRPFFRFTHFPGKRRRHARQGRVRGFEQHFLRARVARHAAARPQGREHAAKLRHKGAGTLRRAVRARQRIGYAHIVRGHLQASLGVKQPRARRF